MAIGEHADRFAGKPVQLYDLDAGLTEPEGTACKLMVDYDETEQGWTIPVKLAHLLEDPSAPRLQALVIGAWGEMTDEDDGSDRIIEALVAAADTLKSIRALFFGDIIYEECEISWIRNGDVTPLLDAYPLLDEFRVRGGNGLILGSLRHDKLRSITVETGGLPLEIVHGLLSSELPALEHLELWIGSENYGRSTTVAELAPLLQGTAFPKLKYLGLRDCEKADELAVAVASAPVLGRIETLDLSLGDLGDAGADALIAASALKKLKKLDIHHHYVSPDRIAALKELVPKLDASDAKDDGPDDRYISVSE